MQRTNKYVLIKLFWSAKSQHMMTIMLVALVAGPVFAALFLNSFFLGPILAPVYEVTIKNGTIAGTFIKSFNQHAFLGIPYAEPPLGHLRFVSPQSYDHSWGNNVRHFTKHGAACFTGGGILNSRFRQSEDCLTLNIVVPHGYKNKTLPVAIWIHGGSFLDGSSIGPEYDLSYIINNGKTINKPFIAVSINYRLSGFGWLSSQEVYQKGYTNVGLRDQLKAIEWVHENIGAFGGNPNHLVLWGESAGGISVSMLLALAKLKSYVKGAIIESGTTSTPDRLNNEGQDFSQNDYNVLAERFNCLSANNNSDSLACLQKVSVTDLVEVFNVKKGFPHQGFHSPYVDGDIVPANTMEVFSSGNFTKVLVLVGTTTDEGARFVNRTDIKTTMDFKQHIVSQFPYLTNSSIEQLNQLYPLGNKLTQIPLEPLSKINALPLALYGEHFARLACFFGDVTFLAFARFAAERISSHGCPVYKYRHNIPDLRGSLQLHLGTKHAAELPYVFDNGANLQNKLILQHVYPSFKAARMAKIISKMWASFIVDLNPNFRNEEEYGKTVSVPEWLDYSKMSKNMVFDLDGFYIEDDDFRKEQFDFLETIIPQLQSSTYLV